MSKADSENQSTNSSKKESAKVETIASKQDGKNSSQKSNSTKVETLDDTISQVFDEIHTSPTAAAKLVPEETGAEQGFIGKHLKKLAEKEEQKKKQLQEEKNLEELTKFGFDKSAANSVGQNLQESSKKRGIMARVQAKIDKELKDQQAIQLSETIYDPEF